MLFHFGSHILTAQDYSWKNYTVSDGLPQTQVISLMQDSDGLIWLGTKNGFSIFDGIEFKNYSTKDGLEFDHIIDIEEHSKGEYLIHTTSGLNRMAKGKITTVLSGLTIGRTVEVLENESTLWLRMTKGEVILWKDGQTSTDHPIFGLLHDGEILLRAIAVADHKQLFFFTSQGRLLAFDGKTIKTLLSAPHIKNVIQGEDGGLYGITADSLFHLENNRFRPIAGSMQGFLVKRILSPGEFFFTDHKTIRYLFHYLDGKIEKIPHTFSNANDVLIDHEGNLWVGSDTGLWKRMSKAFHNYLDKPEENFYTWTVLEDRNGDFIFGSYQKQLKKLHGDSFQTIPLRPERLEDAYAFYSGGLTARNGDALINTSFGILAYNGQSLRWFIKPHINDIVLYNFDDHARGRYLLATSNRGLVEIDYAGNLTRVYNDRLPGEHTELVTSVLRDKYDRIWISGKKGISIRENDRWRHLPDAKDSITIGAISMLMDSAQNIWLGSNDGLYFYDYEQLRKIAPEIFNTQIGVLNMTNGNDLVIGAINGLGLIDMGSFYRSDTATVRFFDRNSGFIGEECKHNSSFKDSDGNIWICTSNCVVKVIPEDLKVNQYPPKVYIKSISNARETMDWEDIDTHAHSTGELVLQRIRNNLRFNYHAISLTAPLGLRYQTMLAGYDKQWSVETTERYRSYTNLPHGRYTFKVKARNSDGVWAIDPAEISIFIQPAWHELLSVKIGGIVGAMLTMIGAGYLFSERKRKRILHETQIEKNLARLQFRSIKGMIDPHFTFNAINSIASMMYRGEKEEAYGYFTKFSRLIRNLFEHAENATRSLKAELEFVKNYLEIEKMRFGDKFDFSIRVAEGLDVQREIPKLIVQIYVENAIKHGLMGRESGGTLEVIITTEQHALHICVRDNGIGRKKSRATSDGKQSLGKGTHIIRDYFDLLNKFNDPKISSETIDLYSDDGTAAGTEVRISIPNDFKFTL